MAKLVEEEQGFVNVVYANAGTYSGCDSRRPQDTLLLSTVKVAYWGYPAREPLSSSSRSGERV